MAEGEVKVKITADSKDADRAVDGFESKVKGMVGNVAKAAAATAAAVAGATVALAGSALDAYADYEQLLGGVQTLYGDSWDAVADNAAQAFQTAGLSANDYMDQTVRMSGALIQSLGGDTEEAARIADMAIRDMSDNANKMGTDIGRIQDAYQGFSRGNFTMLDNLALGYGGTRSEMERLLEDAERIKASQGEMVDYSIDSYADMVEAINVVQTEMGITGTTAEEAASTIQGSIGMAKGAWENWLVGLGDETADLKELTDQLVDSVATAASNIIPRLGQIAESIVEALPDVLGAIAREIPPLFSQFVGPIIDGISQAINDQLGTHVDLLGGIQFVLETLGGAWQNLQTTMGPPMDALRDSMGDLVDHIGPLVEQYLPILCDFVTTYVLPALGWLADAFVDSVDKIVVAADTVGWFVEFCADRFDWMAGYVTPVLQALADFIGQWGGMVSPIFGQMVPNALGKLVAKFQSLPAPIQTALGIVFGNVATWAANVGNKGNEGGSNLVTRFVNWVRTLPSRLQSFIQDSIARLRQWAQDMGNKGREAAQNLGDRLISGLRSIPGRVASIGSQIVAGIASGITGAAGRVVSALGGVVSSAISYAKSRLGIASPSKVFRDEVGKWIPAGVAEGIEDGAGEIQSAFDAAMDLSWAAPALGAGVGAVGGIGGGTVYNLYLDGDLLGVGGRIQSAIVQLVGAVETTYGMGRA